MNAPKTKELFGRNSVKELWKMLWGALAAVDPLEEGHPLGKIGLHPGVVQPALVLHRLDEVPPKPGRVSVQPLHVCQREGQAQRRRGVRQRRQRVLPHKGRQQLQGADGAGALLRQQQRGGRTARGDVQRGLEQLQGGRGQQPGKARLLL